MATELIVVTGASSGIGLETCKALVKQGYAVIGTVRDVVKGKETEMQLHAHWPEAQFRTAVVEIGKEMEETALCNSLKAGGKLVGIINNAGLAGDLPWENVEDRTVASRILNVNYYGLKRITEILDPFLTKDGFIVNLSSGAAFMHMNKVASSVLKKMQGADEAELESMIDPFLAAYEKADKIRERDEISGFHFQAYGFSKALVNRLTELQARKYEGRTVTAVSPGFCTTNMTNTATDVPYTAAEGAEIVVMSTKGPSGVYIDRDAPSGRPLMIP